MRLPLICKSLTNPPDFMSKLDEIVGMFRALMTVPNAPYGDAKSDQNTFIHRLNTPASLA